MLARAALVVACGLLAAALPACGGDPTTPQNESRVDIEGDPLLLLPDDALALARVDAKAFYASSSLGAELGKTCERLVPVGEEWGFVASRDVREVTLGIYAQQSLDVVGVIRGAFDTDRIGRAAASSSVSRSGGMVAESSYAGRKLYTVANVGFTVLSSRTALAGTEWGIRRALDRIESHAPRKAAKGWMLDTLATKGAAFAWVVDVSDQPVATTALGAVDLPFLSGMRAARTIGSFASPGMQVAATLDYADAQKASSGADAIRGADKMAKLFGPLLPQVEELDVQTADTEVKLKFKVNDGSLRTLLGFLPGLLDAGAKHGG